MMSLTEKKYISNGVLKNCRIDGRQIFDFNDISISIGVLPRANGSSKCNLGSVICVVQIMGEIVGDSSKTLGITIDKKSDVTEEQIGDLESVLTNINIPVPHIDEKYNWKLNVTISFLNADGNIVDCCLIAMKAAIWDTTLPKLKVLNGEIEVQEDIYLATRLPSFDKFPISCTAVNLGSTFCLDPRLEEIQAGDIVIHVLIATEVLHVSTTNGGLCTPLLLKNMVTNAIENGKVLFQKINAILKENAGSKLGSNPISFF
eukprot:NODE_33_length_36935_cov_1.609241.p20 type:complete len:260 gc:universal NODE_33_length_36935_cov_1.609241:21371-20592(-)